MLHFAQMRVPENFASSPIMISASGEQVDNIERACRPTGLLEYQVRHCIPDPISILLPPNRWINGVPKSFQPLPHLTPLAAKYMRVYGYVSRRRISVTTFQGVCSAEALWSVGTRLELQMSAVAVGPSFATSTLDESDWGGVVVIVAIGSEARNVATRIVQRLCFGESKRRGGKPF